MGVIGVEPNISATPGNHNRRLAKPLLLYKEFLLITYDKCAAASRKQHRILEHRLSHLRLSSRELTRLQFRFQSCRCHYTFRLVVCVQWRKQTDIGCVRKSLVYTLLHAH